MGRTKCIYYNNFNPRPHAGDDITPTPVPSLCKYFNPRPHAGDDPDENTKVVILIISTHVPTRGTTRGVRHAGPRYADFNPRPHAGDDKTNVSGLLDCNYFNPRPHAGDDPGKEDKPNVQKHFNPRPHAGDDTPEAKRLNIRWNFNPRPHAGDDRAACYTLYPLAYFNPRPHAGDDCTNHQKQRNYSSAYPIFSVHCTKQTIKNPILLFLCVPQFPQL